MSVYYDTQTDLGLQRPLFSCQRPAVLIASLHIAADYFERTKNFAGLRLLACPLNLKRTTKERREYLNKNMTKHTKLNLLRVVLVRQ